MLHGQVVELEAAVAAARTLIAAARRPVALVSSWGSNEELAAFHRALGGRFSCHVKTDWLPHAEETVEDDILIKADKNPNRAAATALYPALPADPRAAIPAGCDLVLVWGEGCRDEMLPDGAKVVRLDAWLHPENARADVFLPISVQTERSGHYTNFAGVVSRFDACFARPAGIADAESLFAALAQPLLVGAAT